MAMLKFVFAVMLLSSVQAIGQVTAEKKINTVQPTIMVIPFSKENEDVRKVFDRTPESRITIVKVKEAFDNRGFSTIDFVAKLKEVEVRKAFTSDNPSDIKSEIIDYSGADIYVEVESQLEKSGDGNSARVILTAYDASTGTSLANKVGFSNKFYTEDFGKLSSKAVENIVEDFLNVMNNKFTEMLENGKFVAVEFAIGEGSKLNMSSETSNEGLPLSDAIELWMEENAFKGYYHIQGSTDLKVIFDQVRIPVKDEQGKSYSTNKFALQVFKFCKSMKFKNAAEVEVRKSVKGQTIFITII